MTTPNSEDDDRDRAAQAAGADQDQPAADVSQLQEQLAAAREEAAGSREQSLRAQAELDNYRKRTNKEFEQMLRYQSLPLARDLLPGLDNLDRAIKAARVSANVEELAQGVEMVVKQFEDVFARHDIKPVAAVGETFDPNLHEAILQIPSPDHAPMTVIEEAERGYVLHDRVVRPSKVVVAQRPAEGGNTAATAEGAE